MRNFRSAILLAAGLSAMVVCHAQGGVRVLLIGDNSTPGRVEDVRAKIQATGRVAGTIDIFNNDGSGVPTLAALNSYDVVMVWTDNGVDDAVGLGDVLADYVDAGGGVIEATFGYYTTGIGLQGRWKSGVYTTMTCTSQVSTAAAIGTRYVSSHPILNGVAAFGGGVASFRCSSTVTAGSYRIADWNDGTPLVATRHVHNGKVAGLNFYPPSATVLAGNWDPATGGGLLMANAINFVSNNSVDVLICGAPATGAWLAEVKDRITEGGRVGGLIDTFDISTATPSLGVLERYDSVMVFTDAQAANNVALGNVLADYVDLGGGVVACTFTGTGGANGLAGRFDTEAYSPFVRGGTAIAANLTLGTRLISQHPLLSSVAFFSGGSSSFHQTGGLRPGAVDVADWSNGRPLVATMPGKKGRVAGLNFYPVSSVSRSDFWDRSNDGAALMGNALTWSARHDNDVLIVGDTSIGAMQSDIISKIGPHIDGTISTFDYTTGTPSIARVRRYDSVMIYANLPATDPNAMGDRLADFVDGGGGVVDMFATTSSGFNPGGRWASGSYSALATGSVAYGAGVTMNAKIYPKHPVLRSVAHLDLGGGGYRNTGGVRAGALELATLSSGNTLAAEKSTGSGRVVTLNFFPASSSLGSNFWNAATDGARLMANSLNHVARSDMDALVVATEDVASALSVDLRAKIAGTSRIRGRVDAFDNRGANPPLGLLQAYDAAFVWADFSQPDTNAWGNTLAAYANGGGGVVTASGAHAGAPFGVQGLWLTRPYTPANFVAPLFNPNATISTRYHPEHPTLAGIDTFQLSSGGLHDFTSTSSIGERIADLSNGRPLIAEAKAIGARQTVAINMFPTSSDASSYGFNAGTKGGLLMANALTYVSRERPCFADFNDDGAVDFFDYDDFVNCFEGGPCPPGATADFDGDGTTDFFDYDAFVVAFETGC